MSNISEILSTIKDLINVRLEMIQEAIQQRISTFIIRLITLVVMGIVTLFVLLFASLSLAFYLSEVSHSIYMGFLYVTGIYILIFLVLYIIRNSLRLRTSLQDSVNRFIFSGKGKNE